MVSKDSDYTTIKILKPTLKYLKILKAQRDDKNYDLTFEYLFKLSEKYGGLK